MKKQEILKIINKENLNGYAFLMKNDEKKETILIIENKSKKEVLSKFITNCLNENAMYLKSDEYNIILNEIQSNLKKWETQIKSLKE